MTRLTRTGWLLAIGLSLALGASPSQVNADQGAAAPAASKRAWLGVDLERGPAGGIVVKHVINNSPASKAGLADGDQVSEVDGDAVDEPAQLIARVALAGPGADLKLKLRRGGVDKTATAQLVAHPGMDQVLRLDKLGTFAPWKSVTTVSGAVPSSITAARGKVVVVDFWASWCAPCRLLAPQLTKWHTTYSSQGLQIVGLTSDEVPVATKAAKSLGIQYAVAHDKDGAAMSAYGAKSLPTMFIIDKKGVIREIVQGYDPNKHAEIEKLLKKLLAEPAPTTSTTPATSSTASPAASTGAAPATSTSAAPAADPPKTASAPAASK